MRSLLLFSLFTATALADGPKDNIPAAVRPIPPTDKAVALPEADKVSLAKELAELRAAIDAAARAQAKNPRLEEFLADIEIYHKAVDWAGRYNEYFNKAEFKTAHDLIAEGKSRAASFLKGEAPWTRQTGLVVRGYRSKIDGSVQPYGMVIPDNYAGSLMRLDFWCHGRGETLSAAGRATALSVGGIGRTAAGMLSFGPSASAVAVKRENSRRERMRSKGYEDLKAGRLGAP